MSIVTFGLGVSPGGSSPTPTPTVSAGSDTLDLEDGSPIDLEDGSPLEAEDSGATTAVDSTPSQPQTLLATDEDILVHAGTDFQLLTPGYQVLAQGADGVFASGSPWVLTSPTVDFEANGVAANNVVWLTTPKGVYGSAGHFLAINGVSGNSMTLRRPYKNLNIGQPPAPASGLNSVTFSVLTLGPQIAEATYELFQRFNIDERASAGLLRNPKFVYDLQVFRAACIYSVLWGQYVLNARTKSGDFDNKVERFREMMDTAIGRLTVRWGATGVSAESTSIFSNRLIRG